MAPHSSIGSGAQPRRMGAGGAETIRPVSTSLAPLFPASAGSRATGSDRCSWPTSSPGWRSPAWPFRKQCPMLRTWLICPRLAAPIKRERRGHPPTADDSALPDSTGVWPIHLVHPQLCLCCVRDIDAALGRSGSRCEHPAGQGTRCAVSVHWRLAPSVCSAVWFGARPKESRADHCPFLFRPRDAAAVARPYLWLE